MGDLVFEIRHPDLGLVFVWRGQPLKRQGLLEQFDLAGPPGLKSALRVLERADPDLAVRARVRLEVAEQGPWLCVYPFDTVTGKGRLAPAWDEVRGQMPALVRYLREYRARGRELVALVRGWNGVEAYYRLKSSTWRRVFGWRGPETIPCTA